MPSRASSTADGGPDLAKVVGRNLRRFRTARGLSLERLSGLSGVSRGMLGQIELGQSAPTINVLWKIARALNVTFSKLVHTHDAAPTVLRAAAARVLTSNDGKFTSRALHPTDAPTRVEFYELRLAVGAVEAADAHPPGTTENLVVASGKLQIELGKTKHELERGDAMRFAADVPHTYRCLGTDPTVLYLVMTYPTEVTADE